MTRVWQSAVVMALITSKANIDARDSVPLLLLLWPPCERMQVGQAALHRAATAGHDEVNGMHFVILRCVTGVAGGERVAGGAM